MRIYWLNPPISTRAVYADVAWMELSSRAPEHKWLFPITDWEEFKDINDVLLDIVKQAPDLVCVSSYVWNYDLTTAIIKKLKEFENTPVVIGGPHQPGFKQGCQEPFDYACHPLAPGEPFIVELLYQLQKFGTVVDPDKVPNLLLPGVYREFVRPNYSFAEDSSILKNIEYLNQVKETAVKRNKKAVINIETTRGCPYSCSFCEWGGGTGTKIHDKPLKTVFEEIDTLAVIGFNEIDISDANFGILKRDADVVQRLADNKKVLGFPESTHVYGVAKVKVEKKEKILDMLFSNGLLKTTFHMSLQSIDPTVLKNAKRTDASLEEMIALAERMKKKYNVTPNPELIMGLPGTTLDIFYEEMNLSEVVGNWDWIRYPYSVLPATEAASEEYFKKYNIQTTMAPVPDNDTWEQRGRVDNVIGKYRSPQELVIGADTYSKEDWKQMFFMNFAQRELGKYLKQNENPSVRLREMWNEISQMEWYKEYFDKELTRLVNGDRLETDFLDYNGMLIEDWIKKYYIDREPWNGINN